MPIKDNGVLGQQLLLPEKKFLADLRQHRIEDIFARQGFEISRSTQSVWCGDMGDLFEPLWELMAQGVRASHVVGTDDTIMPMLAKGKAANARSGSTWVTTIIPTTSSISL